MDADLDTKSRIKAAALRLCVERGVAATTVRDLAQATGIAEGTLYRHYTSKEDLVRNLFQEHYGAFARRIDTLQRAESGIAAKIRIIVADTCRLFDEEPTLYRFLLLVQHEAIPRLPVGGDSPASVLKTMMEDAIRNGELRIDDAALAASLLLGLLVQPALFIVYGGLAAPLAQHCDDIARAAERVLVR